MFVKFILQSVHIKQQHWFLEENSQLLDVTDSGESRGWLGSGPCFTTNYWVTLGHLSYSTSLGFCLLFIKEDNYNTALKVWLQPYNTLSLVAPGALFPGRASRCNSKRAQS